MFDIEADIRCFECKQILSPKCNLKSKNDNYYCVNCYWDLFGRAEMQARFKQTETWDHEMPFL